MGDRISISFKNDKEESVVLFSHWGGMEFLKEAQRYVKLLKDILERRHRASYPIDRLEPNTVMIDFIRYYTCNMTIVESDLYLGSNQLAGDNSDNGHHTIDLNET